MQNYTHTVQYYETDKMGVTHHSNYIRFMEEARVYFLKQAGWPYEKFEEEGIISPVVSISCDYKRTTTFPDIIEIKVDVAEVTPVKFKLSYTMTVAEKLVCTAGSAHCFLNTTGRPVSIQKQYPEFYHTLLELQNSANKVSSIS
ncbi:MAG: acyl-CoA thioesterase [Lachnospiraceae bacterium]|nr:acyl-CoA thioesterase [Lachnospiraceae bacterium]